MRGLDPRIHVVARFVIARCESVDGRIKSGHGEFGAAGVLFLS
jgi:hypothetical protein